MQVITYGRVGNSRTGANIQALVHVWHDGGGSDKRGQTLLKSLSKLLRRGQMLTGKKVKNRIF